MAKQIKKTNPGDAANAFVRCILSQAGTLLGGLSENEWKRTLKRFHGRCAYTGETLAKNGLERDHAIPMNRSHCGLHLFGNVLPATRSANRKKASKHYREFLKDDPERLDRIERFVRQSGYHERVAELGDLGRYSRAQYRTITKLCEVNENYLRSLLPEELEETGPEDPSQPDAPGGMHESGTLPIVFKPSGDGFRKRLLKEGEAWITEIYRDRAVERLHWNAGNMSETSNVIGNIRSRPRYRKGNWERLGIKSLQVSVRRSG